MSTCVQTCPPACKSTCTRAGTRSHAVRAHVPHTSSSISVSSTQNFSVSARHLRYHVACAAPAASGGAIALAAGAAGRRKTRRAGW
eukprot:364545-Chlamydomonas_euryale.AAC.2